MSFHLERRQFDRVLELYDQAIYPQPSRIYSDIFNAASLLWRLEFQGVGVAGRWPILAAEAALRIDDHAHTFTDVHVMMALAGAGDVALAERLLGSLHDLVLESTSFEAQTVKAVSLWTLISGIARATPIIRRSTTISDPSSRHRPKKCAISSVGHNHGVDMMYWLRAVLFSQPISVSIRVSLKKNNQ